MTAAPIRTVLVLVPLSPERERAIRRALEQIEAWAFDPEMVHALARYARTLLDADQRPDGPA